MSERGISFFFTVLVMLLLPRVDRILVIAAAEGNIQCSSGMPLFFDPETIKLLFHLPLILILFQNISSRMNSINRQASRVIVVINNVSTL